MPLLERLTADVKSAMLARESERVAVLRLLQAEAKNAQIKKGEVLSDDELLQVIRKEVKKREEAATLYTQQNHPDRATQELAEAAILQEYLPAALDPSIIETYLQGKLSEWNEAPTPALRGKLIKEALTHFGNQVDGKQVNAVVSALLG